jgi:cytochrome P450
MSPIERPPLVHPCDTGAWSTAVPHDTFTWLRANEPVSRWDDLEGRRGFWLVAHHADVVAVTRDPERFTSRFGVVDLDDHADDELDARRTMLEEDPPRHTQLRRLVSDAFTPRAVRAYEGAIALATDALLDDALRDGTVEFVSSVATKVPIRVLCDMLGVPHEHTDDLVEWGNRLLAAPDPDRPDPILATLSHDERRLLPFGHPASLDAFALADALAAERRARPTDDVTSALVNGLVDGEPLSAAEFRTMWLMLVIAGNETTRHTLSLGLDALGDHPEWVARWQEASAAGDRRWMERATEEVIRWATPINWHRRQVVADTRLGGADLRAGDKLLVSFTSADRDERVFDEPFRFDLEREHNPQAAFGRGGPHFCLGAHLARLEVRIVLTRLLQRVGGVRRVAPPVRLASNHLNGLTRLDVDLG